LNYINANWANWIAPTEISSHRPVVGPIIVRTKQFIADFLFNVVFKGYFERQREFNMNLVRFLNSTARYIDARDAEIFWQIVTKIDNDVLALNERLDRVYDEVVSTVRTLELEISKRLSKLEADRDILVEVAKKTQDSLNDLDQLIRGVERILALASRPIAETPATARSVPGSAARGPALNVPPGVDYLLLENRYRGSEELIKSRLTDYLSYFDAAEGVILDLGCGRGEFIELLKARGREVYGIDLNPTMVAHCQQKGLPVLLADCLDYLEQLPDRSVGGVFAAQLVEHLTREQLDRLVTLAARKIRPAGRLLLETINPQSIVALASNFFRDPTHIWPLHPDTLRFLLEMRGVKTETVLMRSAFPEGAMLQKLPISENLPARWRNTLQVVKDNLDRLNGLLYGHQDFCIVGEILENADIATLNSPTELARSESSGYQFREI